MSIMDIFGNWDVENLREEKGYEVVGKPALLIGPLGNVEDEQIYVDAIEKTNGKIKIDAILTYWKIDKRRLGSGGIIKEFEHTDLCFQNDELYKMFGDESTKTLPGMMVIHALRKIE